MASSSAQTAKKDEKATSEKQPEQATQQKTAAALEEDDEFEDFPVDGLAPSLLLPLLSEGNSLGPFNHMCRWLTRGAAN